MAGPLARLGYGATQGARVAWFMSHYLTLRRIHGPLTPPGEEPPTIKGPRPGWQGLVAAMRELFEQDWKNIEAGIYLPPADLPADPVAAIERSMAFFRDARAVDERRLARRHSEVMKPELKGRFRATICRTSTTRPMAGSPKNRHGSTIHRSRCSSRAQPMSCVVRHWCPWPELCEIATNARSICSMLPAGPGVSWKW